MKFEIIDNYEITNCLSQQSGLTRITNNDLLLTYTDFTDAMPGASIYLIRSQDNGKTWGKPELKILAKDNIESIHASVGITTLSNGRILLPFCQGESLKENPTGNTELVCLYSDDNGITWQGWNAQKIPINSFTAYGQPAELPNSNLVLPIYERCKTTDGNITFNSKVIFSYDMGMTWGDPVTISKSNGANETDLTLLPDGRILAMIRTTGELNSSSTGPGKLYWTEYSISQDNGQTWTPAKKTNILGQNFTASIINNKHLIGVCRGIDGIGRLRSEDIQPTDPHLTSQKGYGIHFFTNQGDLANWKYEFTLPDPGSWKYTTWHEAGMPSISNLPNGNIIVAYYSYKESIIDSIDRNNLSHAVDKQLKRIPHCFKRRICASIIKNF